jgi:hypothetical protein
LIELPAAVEPLGPIAITITPRRRLLAFQMSIKQGLDMRRQRAAGIGHFSNAA